jgi:hypothetical protein
MKAAIYRVRELSIGERFAWGACPTCHAEDGASCYADVGLQLGIRADGGRMRDGDGAHVSRLQAAPFRVGLVGVP